MSMRSEKRDERNSDSISFGRSSQFFVMQIPNPRASSAKKEWTEANDANGKFSNADIELV